MNTKQISAAIAGCPASEQYLGHILSIMHEMNRINIELEQLIGDLTIRVNKLEQDACCRANGIIPD